MFIASRHGHAEAVRILLASGASHDVANAKGELALMAAVECAAHPVHNERLNVKACAEVVRALLESGVDDDSVAVAIELAEADAAKTCVVANEAFGTHMKAVPQAYNPLTHCVSVSAVVQALHEADGVSGAPSEPEGEMKEEL